jgi:hypothetical protein
MIKWILNFFKKKTTSELLREGFNEEQKALKLEEETPKYKEKVCDKHPNTFKKTCPSCREAK